MNFIYFAVIAAVLGMSASATAESGALSAMNEHIQLSALSDLSESDAVQLVGNYLDQHNTDIQQLLKIIETQTQELIASGRIENNSGVWYAINLLGRLRVVEAVRSLYTLISIRDDSFSLISNESEPDFQAFPAAVALKDIGMPTVEVLLDGIIHFPINHTVFQLSALTLEAILGETLALILVEKVSGEFSASDQVKRRSALESLIRIGHRNWHADQAEDFSLE